MVTLPGGRFWSFCRCAGVLGVITLKPDATSMLSLFCVLVCVLAQLNSSAADAAAILVKKIVDSFIVRNLVFYRVRVLPCLHLNVLAARVQVTQKFTPPWRKGPLKSVLLVKPPE